MTETVNGNIRPDYGERTLYEIRQGPDGPTVAGPYASYESAITARSGMVRPFGMVIRREHYWVVPAPAPGQSPYGVQ